MRTDTERLDFLINDPGNLSDNVGTGYLYWYRSSDGYPTGHTKIIRGRLPRETIDAAMDGERGES